jgi:CubicO group peptidase (beta-lactamase class C family)
MYVIKYQTILQSQIAEIMSYNCKFICLYFSLLSSFLLFFQPAFCQRKPKDFGSDKYREVEDLTVQKQHLLGDHLVVMVSNRDTIVYKKTIGDFDDRTIAPVAAASKWLTAALIMELVDEGKLSLEDKVARFIPMYSLYGKNYITIRNCLSHYTGIQSENSKVLTVFSHKKFGSLEDEVNDYAKKEIQSNPGTEFRYSEMGLNIAARVAEIVSKKKFEMLIRQKLFVPLGMRQTSFTNPDGSAPDASTGAVSTASDYMHFLQMLLNKGMYNGQRILSEAAVNMLRTIQTTPEQIKYTPKLTEGFSYALGSWALEENEQHQANVLSSAGLFGTWPIVDFCRGYAALIFVKNPMGEQKADTDKQFIETVSGYFHGTCR